ncbi:RNA polymerase sigma factor RpoE [Lachnospiraceae bacterium KM106-2]|nr:RNA polymerase sigma factor RpoE [Lachnospiraceae bacterium KM106-2]
MNLIEAVESVRQGKEEGMSWLYQETYQKSYYVALKYMKQEEAALDVLQDSYIKAFRSIDQLKVAEKFPSWLARIVACTALDELKRKKPVLFTQFDHEEEGTSFELEIEDDRIDTQPELAYDKKEVSEMVNEMVESLSDEQRMCIMMYYLEQMSVNEIAEALNCSANTVKSRLNYGRNNIKKQVEEMEKRGIKLYSVSPFMFFLLLLRLEGEQMQVLPPVMAFADAVMEGISKSAEANAAAAKTAASGAAKVTTATKILVGVGIASVVGIGTIFFGGNNHRKPKLETKVVQEATMSPKPTEIPVTLTGEIIESTATPEPTEAPSVESEALEAYAELLAGPEYSDYGFQIVKVGDLPYPILILSVNTFSKDGDTAAMTENNGEESQISAYSAVLCGYDQKKQVITYVAPEEAESGDSYDADENSEFIQASTFSYGASLAYDKKNQMIVHNSDSAGGTTWLSGFTCKDGEKILNQVMEYLSSPSGDYEFTYEAKEYTTNYYNHLTNESGKETCRASDNSVLSKEGEVPKLEEIEGEKLICYRNTEERRNEILKQN